MHSDTTYQPDWIFGVAMKLFTCPPIHNFAKSLQVGIQKARKIALVAFNAKKPIPQKDIAAKALPC